MVAIVTTAPRHDDSVATGKEGGPWDEHASPQSPAGGYNSLGVISHARVQTDNTPVPLPVSILAADDVYRRQAIVVSEHEKLRLGGRDVLRD